MIPAMRSASPETDVISGTIVDCAFQLHTQLGPGLLESVYEVILTAMLEKRGLRVVRQQPVEFEFDGMSFNEGLKPDLVINGLVIVELKSVETVLPVHHKQLLTYLRLMNLRVGLLINFGAPSMKQGIKRIVNGPSVPPCLRVSSPQ